MTSTISHLPAFLAPYRSVCELIAQLGGENCEVVLHDLSDPVRSVVLVINGHVTGRAPGQGVRHLVPDLLRSRLAESDSMLLPQYWFRHEGRLVRSLSLLIPDGCGELAGALCVNIDASEDERLFEKLSAMLPRGLPQSIQSKSISTDLALEAPDEFANPEEGVLKMVSGMVDRIVGNDPVYARDSADGKVLKKEDRLRLVAFMQSRGVFLVKGAIEYAAQRLGVSKVTLYSDLDCLKRIERSDSTK